MRTADEKIIGMIEDRGGLARTRDFLAAGIHPQDLYRMRDEGVLECISRGLYQVAGQTPEEPDLATICKKIEGGVICLVSALSIHEITTEIPRCVNVALKRGSEKPRIDYPPVQYYWMSGAAFSDGVEKHDVGGFELPVYCIEKTLADCFKYRNKIGMDVVLEALKFYRERCRFDGTKIMHYARVCRVDNIMRPYLEATL